MVVEFGKQERLAEKLKKQSVCFGGANLKTFQSFDKFQIESFDKFQKVLKNIVLVYVAILMVVRSHQFTLLSSSRCLSPVWRCHGRL